MKQLLLVNCIFFGCILSLQSQQPVQLDFDPQNGKNFIIFCDNISFSNYTVEITFTRARNLSVQTNTPYRRVVRPGRTQLMKIKYLDQTFLGDKSIDFDYEWSYSKGCLGQSPDSSIVYLLPIGTNKSTSIIPVATTDDVLDIKDEDDFTVGFSMNPGDTIFSTRRGMVVGLVEEYETVNGPNTIANGEINHVEIMHNDCSFADYWSFKKDGIFVTEGQWVEAGTPLGIVHPDFFSSGPQVRFNVRYNYRDRERINEQERINEFITFEVNSWAFVKPTFWTKAEGNVQLKEGNKYESEHPEKLIIQEMSKREIKRLSNEWFLVFGFWFLVFGFWFNENILRENFLIY
ncbi:MAG: hypothetical protein AAFO07_05960 [Bacteroidota bacterium]